MASNDVNVKAVITAKDDASSTLKKFGQNIEAVGNGASKFLGEAVSQATVIATAGLAAVTAGAISSVRAFEESQNLIAQTNAVLQSTSHVAGVAAYEVTELAKALQKTTKYSDEDVRSVENLLLTFTSIGKDIFPKATETVLDMATALGEDTKSASIQLGKALQDPILGITALRRVGVNFSDAQKDVIAKMVETGHKADAQKAILKELNVEFGGSAVAAGQTFAGSLAKLKNALNDIQEALGQLIADAVVPAIDWLAKLAQSFNSDVFIEKMKNDLTELKRRFEVFMIPIEVFILNHKQALLDFFTRWGQSAAILIPLLASLAVAWGVLTSPLFLIITALTIGWELWEKNRLLFIALTVVLGPLALAFLALQVALKFQAMIEGLNVAITVLTGTNIAATAATEGLAVAIWSAVAAAATPIILVVGGLALIYEAIQAVNQLKGAWDAEARSEKTANDSYDKMVTDARTQYAAGKITKDRLNALTQGRATGGPVSSNTPYIVGERGPELFVPAHAGTIVPNNQLATKQATTINLSVNVGTYVGTEMEKRKLAEDLFRAYNDLQSSRGMAA